MTILRIESKPNEVYEQQRAELVAEAASKPILHLHQFDCFLNARADDVFRPDSDGDALFHGETHELRRMGADVIRVHIPVGVSQKDAVRALKKILRWVKSDPKLFEAVPNTREIGFFERLCCREFADVTLKDARRLVVERRREEDAGTDEPPLCPASIERRAVRGQCLARGLRSAFQCARSAIGRLVGLRAKGRPRR
jgi:hypothetical protein